MAQIQVRDPARDIVLVTALVFFNIGVEVGQLAVIGLAFLAVGWFRNRDWYRHRIVLPISVAIAVLGVTVTIQRWFF